MGRSPCCEKVGLKKGPWTPEEDQKLLAYIEEHGHGSWRALPAKAGLQRCGKSCRLRWTNYLRPDIKRGKFSLQEEQTIIQLHALLGNRWSAIATHLPKRTDNEIKNYWNTHLKKRLAKMGIDPVTHKPKSETLASSSSSSVDGQSNKSIANLSHMAQWESARLEAEARLARESKLRAAPSSYLKLQQHHQLGSLLLLPPHNKSAPLPGLDEIPTWQGQGVQGQIDLESPSSTLSYSESIMPAVNSIALADHHHSPTTQLCPQGNNDTVLEGDEVEWKCFGKPIRLFDNKNHRMGGFPLSAFSIDHTTTVFGSESSWLQESSSTRTGSSGRDLVSGFTDMLLDNSDEQNSSKIRCAADSENAEGGSCVEEEEEEEDEKDEAKSSNYWNSILDLVNSPPPSTSPPPVF